MQPSRLLVSAAGVMMAAAVAVSQPAAPPVTGSGDFQVVTSKLDQGGTFFMFSDMHGSVERVATLVESFTAQANEMPMRLFPMYIRMGGKALGVDAIEALGASEVPAGEGVRQKTYLLMRKPAGLFTLLGKPSAAMNIAKYAPTDAAVAAVKDVKYGEILPLVRNMVSSIMGAQGMAAVEDWLGKAKREGADLEVLLGSLSGETMFWLRLDETNKMTVGDGKDAMTVARPGIVVVLATSSPAIFDAIKVKNSGHEDKLTLLKSGDGEMLVSSLKEKNPMDWAPLLAQRDGHLFIASSQADLELALKAAGDGGLFASERFKTQAEGMPGAVSAVGFVGPQVYAFASDVLSKMGQMKSKEAQGVASSVKSMLGHALPSKNGSVTWAEWDADGLMLVTQGDKVDRGFSQSGAGLAVPIMAAIAVPNFMEAGVRSKVSRTKADMRTMATGLEAYYVDSAHYPMQTAEPDDYIKSKSLAEKGIPSLRRSRGVGSAMAITTPIAYLTQAPDDPFASSDTTFGYYTVTTEKAAGWILWSPGPDEKYDLDWKVYDPAVPQPSTDLIPYTYDPTNGTVSSGDIFRVKQ